MQIRFGCCRARSRRQADPRSGRTAREAKDILLRNLATVIEARATDIVEFVQQEIRDSGYAERLAYGIVLTGGSARLKDIDELFRRVTGMDVRIASAETGISEDSREAVANPAFATVVGLLLKGAGMGSCNVIEDKAGLSPRRPVPPTSVPGFQPRSPSRGRNPSPMRRHGLLRKRSMRRMRVGRLPVRNPQRPSPRRTMPERSPRLRLPCRSR